MTTNELKLRRALLALLTQVDYTVRACSMTDLVGAVLAPETIDDARRVLAETDEGEN
jgi:hypothetical protein